MFRPRALVRYLRQAVTNPRAARDDALVLRDLLQYRRASAPIRRARPRRATDRTLLIVSLSDFVYQLKLEGMLGKALELEGCQPVVLVRPDARWAKPYLRALGIERFAILDGLVDAASERAVESALADFLAGNVTVQTLKRFTFRDAHVGEQTISTLSRRFERGRISLDDAQVGRALREILREAMMSVYAAERLLDQFDPDVVLFNEKGYVGFGSVYDVALARGANVIQFVASGIHWRDALLFKRYTDETRRVHPTSLSPESWSRARELPWTPEREQELAAEFDLRYGGGEMHPDAGLQAGKRIKAPDEVRAQLGLDREKKTAVLFSHVLWDANLFFGEDLFEDQETWLVESVKAACRNKAVDWVVKLHPANMYKTLGRGGSQNDEEAIRAAVGELPTHVRLLRPETDINTFSLFELADYGITIRGTVGIELPCFGVPVLTAGTGRYSGMGFTNDSSSASDYLAKLERIQEIPPLSEAETLLAKRHAYALFHLRPLRFTSYQAHFMPANSLRHPLSHNLTWKLQATDEVEEATDLHAFADWALDSSRLDYLREPT